MTASQGTVLMVINPPQIIYFKAYVPGLLRSSAMAAAVQWWSSTCGQLQSPELFMKRTDAQAPPH